MNKRRKSYDKHKYDKGKFCIPCLLRHGEYVPVTNVSRMWCCVTCAKHVTWWHKKHLAAADIAREEDGPRELQRTESATVQLSDAFWLLVGEALR